MFPLILLSNIPPNSFFVWDFGKCVCNKIIFDLMTNKNNDWFPPGQSMRFSSGPLALLEPSTNSVLLSLC